MYSFRLRLQTGTANHINIPEELTFEELGITAKEVFKATGSLPQSIAFWRHGFANAQSAQQAGASLRTALRILFVEMNWPFQFDSYGGGVFTVAGREMAEAATGTRILDDQSNLMIYETEPTPKFFRVGLAAKATREASTMFQRLPEFMSRSLTERQSLASEIFGASLEPSHPRVGFLSLITAVEILAPEREAHKNASKRDAIERMLVALSEASEFEGKSDFVKRFEADFPRESITSACSRMVKAALGRKRADLFDDLYKLRSELVHTGSTRSEQDWATRFNQARELVRELLLSQIQGVASVG